MARSSERPTPDQCAALRREQRGQLILAIRRYGRGRPTGSSQYQNVTKGRSATSPWEVQVKSKHAQSSGFSRHKTEHLAAAAADAMLVERDGRCAAAAFDC